MILKFLLKFLYKRKKKFEINDLKIFDKILIYNITLIKILKEFRNKLLIIYKKNKK